MWLEINILITYLLTYVGAIGIYRPIEGSANIFGPLLSVMHIHWDIVVLTLFYIKVGLISFQQ